MTEKQHSAEKDLLRLIENPGEIDAKKAELSNLKTPAVSVTHKISLFSRSKRFQKSDQKSTFSFKAFFTDRKQILRFLFVATLCAFIYFVVTVMHEYSKMKNTKSLIKFTYVAEGKEARVTEPPEMDLKSGVRNVESEAMNLRNIFKPGGGKKEEEKRDEATVALSDYRLVGISLEAAPDQTYAMVKNVKTNITFFLKKGEKLDGMELLNIFDNKLLLKVKGKEVELR